MRVEALYRDGHKELIVCPASATLVEVVKAAKDIYAASQLKHLKVVDDDKSAKHRNR